MRINSATRSDVFNEYVKIISNFNLKHNKTASATGEAAEDVGKLIKSLEDARLIADSKTAKSFWNLVDKNINFFDPIKIGLEKENDVAWLISLFKKKSTEFSKRAIEGGFEYIEGSRSGFISCNTSDKDNAIKYIIENKGFDFDKTQKFRKALNTENSSLTEFLKDDILRETGRNAASSSPTSGTAEVAQEGASTPHAEPPKVESPAAPPAGGDETGPNRSIRPPPPPPDARIVDATRAGAFMDMLINERTTIQAIKSSLEKINTSQEAELMKALSAEKGETLEQAINRVRAYHNLSPINFDKIRRAVPSSMAAAESAAEGVTAGRPAVETPTPAASPVETVTPPVVAPTPPPTVAAANEAARVLTDATPEEIRASIAALSSELSKSTKDMVGKIGAIEGNLSTLETSLKNFKDPEITQISEQLKTLQSDLKTLSERATQPAAAPVVAEEAKGLFSRIKEVLSERLITRLKGTPAAKAAEEAAATAEKSAKETEALAAATKRVKEAEEALKAAKSATTKSAEAAATSQAAKSIGSALKTLAGVGLAVGATYAVYKAVTGEDMPEEIADTTSDINPIETGVPGSSENPINPNNSSEVSDSLSTPEGRASIQDQLNNLANSNPNSYNKLLSSMEKIFGATGKYKLERPIRIKGERVEYVFPRQAAGSRNPLDPGRAKAAEEYMYKLLENKGRKASNIKGRILTDANSENPMEIANYMFSTIANKGLFKGLGTGRAGRYGRGAGIREIENKGFSGSQEERMTRKERRALRDISRNQFDQGDETPLSDDFDSSPMKSFSSGYNELFEKYSSDLDNSINNSEIMKKADKTSKRYFKDAVKDLSSDSFMSDYYAGFSKLYDSKVKKKKSDYSKLYDVQEETGSNRIHKAHPEAIVVADAIGNGGLVENASESSKAMQDVASRMPTGNYRARYAFIQNALKKASS